jgi:hypothetical protein
MAHDLRLSNAAANVCAVALSARFNSGYCRIYDGTIPTTADTAVGSQHLLAELRYASDAAASETNGVITFGTITADDGLADYTATWFRDLESDGTTVICDGTVGTSTCDLILNNCAITTGAPVSITSKTHTVPKS